MQKNKSTNFELVIDDCDEQIWQRLQRLNGTTRAPWTILMLSEATGLSRMMTETLVRRLILGGYVDEQDRIANPNKAGVEPRRYSLARESATMPLLNDDGSPAHESITATLWRTMRMLKTFSAAYLGHQASTELRGVTDRQAGWYINRLVDVGILVRAGKTKRGMQPEYTLIKNSGPTPPRVLRATVVYDDNLQKVVGVAVASEVRI